MDKRIGYIGTYATGTLHQMFDTCFLHVCALVSSSVDCYKHKSTFAFIEEKGVEYGFINKVKLNPIKIHRSSSKIGGVIDTLLSALRTIYLYCKCPKDELVVVNYNNVFALWPLNALCRITKRPVFVVCHGEMELLSNGGGGGLARINRKIICSFFYKCQLAQNLHFLVLGDSIYRNLSSFLLPTVYKHFHSIDHPYYLDEVSYKKVENSGNTDRPLALGLIGTLSPEKGLNDFIKFINLLKTNSIKYDISIIGRVSTHQYDTFFSDNNVSISWVYLPRDEMEKRISSLDYALFFYPTDSYRLIASGALFDPIQLNVPVLALHNDYFEYILDKTKHPSALFNNVEEMVDFLKRTAPLYTEKETNTKIFSPECVAKQFESIISEII